MTAAAAGCASRPSCSWRCWARRATCYAEAVPSQGLEHWVGAHVHAFEALGCVPRVVVCDNLRSGVTRAHRYEPDVNATYEEMAAHYGVAIIPTRPGKPRDKAKVEAGVLLAERWILARLRNRRFYSLAEANVGDRRVRGVHQRAAVPQDGRLAAVLVRGARSARRCGRCRSPATSSPAGGWGSRSTSTTTSSRTSTTTRCPTSSSGARVDVRVTASTVEVFHALASSGLPSAATTHRGATPPTRRTCPSRTAATPSGARAASSPGPTRPGLPPPRWPRRSSPARPHPEQGYRSCLGIIRLAERYGADRVEAACARALAVRALSYRSVESILRHGLDSQPLRAAPARTHPHHQNLRGSAYYQ